MKDPSDKDSKSATGEQGKERRPVRQLSPSEERQSMAGASSGRGPLAAAARALRIPYVPPSVVSDDVFETLALSCASGFGCPPVAS